VKEERAELRNWELGFLEKEEVYIVAKIIKVAMIEFL
jgi:hypothetical protein